jgi:hypothetical protein
VRQRDGLTVRYRLLSGTGELLDEGEARVEMAGGALVLSPDKGEVLRVAAADIVEISEPEPYAVRLALPDGVALHLLRLGGMRTQLLAELADARATGVTRALLLDGLGEPEVFPGAVAGIDAELRLYDDALVVLPARGHPEKVPYPFIREVTTDASGYQVSLRVSGQPPVELSRLARRTTEFVDLVRDRCAATSGRTAAFLGALLPGLGPIALRATAARLRDGLAGSRADLDAIDATIWPALTEAATLPARLECLRLLERLGTVWIGFKQTVSVRVPAQGGARRPASAVPPHLGEHTRASGGDAFGSGLGGVFAAGMMAGGPPTGLGFDAPFQTMGAMLAYRMLGTGSGFGGSGFGGSGFGGSGFGGSGFGNQHRVAPRSDVARGQLIPAGTDPDALVVSGDRPTVLAFALCLTPGGRLVYEVLNDPDHATYLSRAATPEDVAAVNLALDVIGFRVAAATETAATTETAGRLPALRLLRDRYAGRVDHSGDWADRLRTLSAG